MDSLPRQGTVLRRGFFNTGAERMGRGLGKLGLYILSELERRSFAELRDLLPADATDRTYNNLRKAAVSLADAGLIEIRKKKTGLTKRDPWKITLALPGRMPSEP